MVYFLHLLQRKMRPILVSSSMDATIRIWDVATQKQLEALPYKESQVNDLCITPDGAQLLIGAWQNLRIYDLQCPSPQGLHTFSVHEKNVTSVGFQVDGVWMYTGGEDCMAKIWDMRINQLNCQRIFQVNTPVHSVVLHPNQVELIVADSTGSIYLWDLRSDRDDQLFTEVDMSEYFVHVDIDRLGLQCAAVTNRGHLFLWDVSHTGMMIPQQQPKQQVAEQPQQQPQEDLYILPSQMPNEEEENKEIEIMAEKRNCEATEEEGEPITTATGGLMPPVPAELGTFQMPYHQQDSRQQVQAVPEAGGKGATAVAMNPGAIVTTVAQQAPSVHHPIRHPPQLRSAMPIPSGLSQQHAHPQLPSLTLFNSASKYTKLRAHKTFGLKCRFRPDGLAVATTSADQTAKLWSTSTRKLLNTYSVPGNKWVWDCAFTNDSNYMVTATSDGILRMWELGSGSVARTYQGHSMGITNCRLAQLP